MSIIREALEHHKEQVVADARAELALLASKADDEVKGAAAKLESLVASWEQAAERLQGFGLSSIAEIALSGGAVWVVRGKPGSRGHVGNVSASRVALGILEGIAYGPDQGPYVQVPPGEAEYEMFMLVMPVKPTTA